MQPVDTKLIHTHTHTHTHTEIQRQDRGTHRMKAITPTLHMSVARLSGSKFTTSGAEINNNNINGLLESTQQGSDHHQGSIKFLHLEILSIWSNWLRIPGSWSGTRSRSWSGTRSPPKSDQLFHVPWCNHFTEFHENSCITFQSNSHQLQSIHDVFHVVLLYCHTDGEDQNTRGLALNRVQTSRRPRRTAPSCWALSHRSNTEPQGCLKVIFALFDPVNLTFDLILIGGWGIVMDYPCTKFGNFSFSQMFWFYRAARRQTESQTHEIAILTQLLSVWVYTDCYKKVKR